MSLTAFQTLSCLRNLLICSKKFACVSHHVRNASKTAGTPGIAGLGSRVGKVTASVVNVKISVLPVETNVERLQTHLCGSNLLKEGGEDVELKPDNEYPDWLWNLNVGPSPHYSELSQDDIRYWILIKRIHYRQQARIKARMRFH